MTHLDVASATDPGARRAHNEDAALAEVPLLAVADGMGGPGVGDVASGIVVDVLRSNAELIREQARRVDADRSSRNRLDLGRAMEATFQWAHVEVKAASARVERPAMATTLALAVVTERTAFIAHVGNSRAYLLRGGQLERLTDDHTLAELRRRRGREANPEDAQRLYQMVGAGTGFEVDFAEVPVADGDVLLLCTDGLVRALPESEIASIVGDGNMRSATARLIAAARAAGAPDNLAVALARIEGGPDRAEIRRVADILRSTFLFRDIGSTGRLAIAPWLEERVVETGEDLMREGEPADVFYVVIEGALDVTREGVPLTTIRNGAHLGELALARPVARSATATAAERTTVWGLSRDSFHSICKRRPELGARLALALLDSVGDRLRDLTERVAAAERPR